MGIIDKLKIRYVGDYMCALLCICKCAIYKYISYFGGYYKQGYMRSIDLDLSEKGIIGKGILLA